MRPAAVQNAAGTATVTLVASQPAPQTLATPEGLQLAWSSSGAGSPAVLLLPAWVSNLAGDCPDHGRGRLIGPIALRRRVIAYDRPGTGMSDRCASHFDVAEQVSDALRVVDAAGEPRVAVFAAGFSGPVAIALAARHPARVSHLILFGATPGLAPLSPWTAQTAAVLSALGQLIEADWRLGARALADLLIGETSSPEREWFASYQEGAADSEAAARLLRVHSTMDVADLVRSVQAPTLVLQRRGDRVAGVSVARHLCATLPNAQLVLLQGSANLPFATDVADVVARVEAFVDDGWRSLTTREMQALARGAEGLSNREVASRLGITEATVARHLAAAYRKLRVHRRREAFAYARQIGLIGAGPTL